MFLYLLFSFYFINNKLPVPLKVSLRTEPKLSSTMTSLLNGSVPLMNGSIIPFVLSVCKPVWGSILTKLIPEGTLNGI